MRLSMSWMVRALTAIGAIFFCAVSLDAGPSDVIKPGAVWLDNRSNPIQAHGGSVIELDKTYFWFGEDRSRSLDRAMRFVACYSSQDLVNWTFRNRVLA